MDVLISITTLLLIVAMFSVWANRLLFNPDNWANTSTQLLQNSDIRSTTANYLVDQLYANYNVAGLIKHGLPSRLQGLAAPAAGALRNAAVQGTELALSRPRVQNLWREANRAADKTFIAVVNGGGPRVSVNQGVVTLNLGVILDNVAARLGLPNVASKLPPNIANLTIFKSNQLKTVQNGGQAIKGLALWLTILCPLLYALAVFLAAGHRRRTLMTVGFAAIFAGIVVFFGRNILQTQITNSLTDDASLRPAIRATIAIGTQLLVEVAGAVTFMGVLLVIAAWFAGPARIARAAREAIAPFLRRQPGRHLRDHARAARAPVHLGPDSRPPGHRPGSSRSRCSGCSPPPSCASRPSASFPTRGMAPQHTRSGRACPACAATKTRSTARRRPRRPRRPRPWTSSSSCPTSAIGAH